MVNFNSYWCHVIIFFVIILFCTEKSSAQFSAIQCYECTNCSDPFTVTSAVAVGSSCYSCYKLAVAVAYAPYTYVVRRCLEACIETSQNFGGGSVRVSCCATSLCNTSSMIKFPLISRFSLLIFIILSFTKRFY